MGGAALAGEMRGGGGRKQGSLHMAFFQVWNCYPPG